MAEGATDVADLLVALIRNACVNEGTPESGHEHRSVATLTDFLGVLGTVIEPLPGRRSAVWRIPGGRPGAPRLLLMAHTDVVPADPRGWSVDPFGAEIADGFVWGRGAVDMLNLAAAMAVVFRPYVTGEKAQLPGDLLFAAVADEEAAGLHGAAVLTDSCWDLVGAEYVLTEIAYPAVVTSGGRVYPISVGEKGPWWTKLRTRGVAGHGSQPYGRRNALRPLADALQGLFETPTPVAISEEWRAFVLSLGLSTSEEEGLTDPNRIDAAIEEMAVTHLPLASYVHACTHLTVSPNRMWGGIKANIIPDRAEAEIDIRSLPGQDQDMVDDHLRKAMGAAADQVEVVPMASHAANSSPVGNPLWEAIVQSIESHTGSRRVAPTLQPAATDARFFRDRGSVAYGVGLFDDRVEFGDFLAMFHGDDERVSLDSLDRTVSLLVQVVARFGELTAG